jgi:tRNA threonylcarbamoyladenosine biosynthesis protein TsaB
MKPRCVLAIETSTRSASVALKNESGALAERLLETGSMQGRELAPAVDALLQDRELGPEAMDLVVVGLGPGSYTGLRVGIAFARGFAFALRRPVRGVSSFAALALQEGAEGERVLCVNRAGQDEFYHALYRIEAGGAIEEAAPGLGSPDEVFALAEPGIKIRGEGADAFKSRGAGDVAARVPRAGSLALLGERAYGDHGATPEAELAPLYLRRSKAEINWERRKGTGSDSGGKK